MSDTSPITGKKRNPNPKLGPDEEVPIVTRPKGRGNKKKKHDGSAESLLKSKKKKLKKRKSSGSYGEAALGGVTEKDLFYGLEETDGSKEDILLPKKRKPKKRKPFEPFVTMEAKGGGKIKGYKKGGPITYRMTGGQVVGNSYD